MKLQEKGSNKSLGHRPKNLQQQVTKNTSNDLNKSLNCIKTPHQTAYTLQDKKKPNGNEKLATGRRPGNDGKPTHNYRVLERLKIYQNKNLIQLKRLPKSPVPRMGYHQKITPTTQENKKG